MDALEAISRRHGVLQFKSDPVSRETIEQILRSAACAPSPANTQPWEFIVVDDSSLSRQIAEYLIKTQEEYVFRRLLGTPEPFIEHLLGLYNEFRIVPCFIILCRHQRTEISQTSFKETVRDWDLCSLGAAMANLMTAATALDLGTRWFGNPMLNPEPLGEILMIPSDNEIIAVTPLGYHDEPLKERPLQSIEAQTYFKRGDKKKLAALLKGKLGLHDFVHFNTYDEKAG